MDFAVSEEHEALRRAVAKIAADFGGAYYARKAEAREFTGELWQASLEDRTGPALPVGTPVTITGIDALRLIVRPATAAETDTAGVDIIDALPPGAPAAATPAPKDA